MRKLYLAALTASLLAAPHPLNGQMILSQPIPKEVAQALEQEQQAARHAARGQMAEAPGQPGAVLARLRCNDSGSFLGFIYRGFDAARPGESDPSLPSANSSVAAQHFLGALPSAIFELVINLRTAKMLGLDVPARLLARADQVIAARSPRTAAPRRLEHG